MELDQLIEEQAERPNVGLALVLKQRVNKWFLARDRECWSNGYEYP